MLTKYSTEFKTNVVKAYLEQKSKDPELSVSSFLKCYDPNLNLKSVYNWISSYKIVAGQSLSMSENEIQNKFGTQANEMTLQQKYAIVKETSGMNEEEKGAYCREHGIYASDLQRWDEECNLALANTLFAQSNGADTKQLKSEIKELKQQVTSLQRDCNKKDREIDRKDKALATYAAKVITLKNFSPTLQGARGRLTSLEERNKAVNFITENTQKIVNIDVDELCISEKYRSIKLSIEWYCSLIGVDKATFYRWKKNKLDKRKDSSHPRFKQYSQEHENKVLKAIKLNPDLTADELIATYLDKHDDAGKPIGYYIGSRSYVYRLMHKYKLINAKRAGGKGRKHNFNKNKLVATGPNQVYVWDITYIYKNIEGEYFYLYAMMDLYSRKMIYWEVHKTQSAEIAAKFLENSLAKENIAIKGHLTGRKSPINADVTIQDKLILHSDNGGPMKGKNMLVKMESLGGTASYSRPHHSNDNAHMESSFATLKHSHSMPIPKCFASLDEASKWMNEFYDWYNNKHLHSGINFITPNDCHNGLAPSIMKNRNRIIKNSEASCYKLYRMPKQVTLMSFATKRKAVEKSTKKYDYQNCKEAA